MQHMWVFCVFFSFMVTLTLWPSHRDNSQGLKGAICDITGKRSSLVNFFSRFSVWVFRIAPFVHTSSETVFVLPVPLFVNKSATLMNLSSFFFPFVRFTNIRIWHDFFLHSFLPLLCIKEWIESFLFLRPWFSCQRLLSSVLFFFFHSCFLSCQGKVSRGQPCSPA